MSLATGMLYATPKYNYSTIIARTNVQLIELQPVLDNIRNKSEHTTAAASKNEMEFVALYFFSGVLLHTQFAHEF